MPIKELFKKKPDKFLLIICIFLVIFGLFILTSVSSSLSQEKYGDVYYILKRQIEVGLLPGLILGIIAYLLPISFIKKMALPLLILNLICLGLVFVPQLGISSGGATRWLNLGFISIQPSEFFKLSFFIYLAAWLANREKKYKNAMEVLIPFLIVVGISAFLILKQPNLSTFGIIMISGMIMYFTAGTPIKHTLLIIVAAVGGLFLAMTTSYRLDRLMMFLNSSLDPMNKGYQIKQALIAVGSGGLSGLGLGMSRQKFGFLPEPVGDSIFPIFAEEMGFIGAAALVILFLLFAWRGFTIIKRSADKFSSLLALGIISWLTIQAFYNMAAMIQIAPLTGIPLPFISYGGSALTAELIAVGLLLNISKNIISNKS